MSPEPASGSEATSVALKTGQFANLCSEPRQGIFTHV